MKNSKLRRALLLVASAVLLVCVSVGATLAYLTSETEVVTNTFTVGNVNITLDETNTDGKDKNGAANTADTKDPQVHVDANSEDCYIFVKVENAIAHLQPAYGDGKTIAEQMTAKGWVEVENVTNVWCYYGLTEGQVNSKPAIVTAGSTVKVFDTFSIIGDAHNNTDGGDPKFNLADVKKTDTIDITAYAIQADGLETYTAAQLWAAFNQ